MFYTFQKYQSSGNDFIIIKTTECFPANIVSKLCNRKFGIGADGLILISKNDDGGFNLKYYNSDGTTDTLCGNGNLCSIDFANKNLNITNYTFHASDGLYKYIFSTLDSKHKVMFHELHKPILKNIPIPNNFKSSKNELSDFGYFINTGSPHYVIFTKDINEIDIVPLGKILRKNTNINKDGCNIDFVQIVNKNSLKIRTYERGVENETLSCGTGSVAAAICFSLYKNDNKITAANNHYTIILNNKGGEHIVSYDIDNSMFYNIYLQGEPKMVFSGTIEI